MDETCTSLSVTFGDLTFEFATDAGLTPELADHIMARMRRHLVAAARQLGLDQPLADEASEQA